MSNNSNPIVVVADRDKFAFQLGLPSNRIEAMAVPVIGGVLIATSVGMAQYLAVLSGMGMFTKIAVAIGIVATPTPVAPLAYAALAGLGGGGIILCVRNIVQQNTIESCRSYNSPLDKLGVLVAKHVFWPAIALAGCKQKRDTNEFKTIVSQMKRWGYDPAWVNDIFISDATQLGEDALLLSIEANSSRPDIVATKTKNDCSLDQLNAHAKNIAKEVLAEHNASPKKKFNRWKKIHPVLS